MAVVGHTGELNDFTSTGFSVVVHIAGCDGVSDDELGVMNVVSFGVTVEAMERVEVAHWKVEKLQMVKGESLEVVGQDQHCLHRAPSRKTHHQSLP